MAQETAPRERRSAPKAMARPKLDQRLETSSKLLYPTRVNRKMDRQRLALKSPLETKRRSQHARRRPWLRKQVQPQSRSPRSNRAYLCLETTPRLNSTERPHLPGRPGPRSRLVRRNPPVRHPKAHRRIRLLAGSLLARNLLKQ